MDWHAWCQECPLIKELLTLQQTQITLQQTQITEAPPTWEQIFEPHILAHPLMRPTLAKLNTLWTQPNRHETLQTLALSTPDLAERAMLTNVLLYLGCTEWYWRWVALCTLGAS